MIRETPNRHQKAALHKRENEVAAALVVYLRQQQIDAIKGVEEDPEEEGLG